MHRIKALVIENDILFRRVFYNILNGFESVETTVICNFDDLPSVLKGSSFDVAFLNVGEPNELGEKIFEHIKAQNPNMSIIATAKRTEKGAEAIILALKNGAVDFITKPARHNAVLMAGRHFEKRVTHIIENMIHTQEEITWQKTAPLAKKKKFSRQRAKMVIIGSGSEGIKTLHTIFKKLPGNLAAPVIVVSHIPKIFTKKLAEWLNKDSELEINEAYDGALLKPGKVWIVPGGFHGEVTWGDAGYIIRLHRGPRVNEVRPSIDVTFRSVARLFGEGALGVVLSGYGHDGFSGAQQLKEWGGQIIVQKPEGLFASKLLRDILKADLGDQICSEEYLCWEIMKRSRLSKKAEPKAPITLSAYSKSDQVLLSPD